ncbi:MAG: CRISPR-associated helicase Cas3' [Nitrososphaerota archaeon]
MASSCEGFQSHPGVPLKDHLRSVGESCRKVLEEAGIEDEHLLLTAEVIGKTHDFGKYSSYFQASLKEGVQGQVKKGGSRELYSHAPISAAYGAWAVHKLLKGLSDRAPLLVAFALVSIYTHHRNLSVCLKDWIKLLESITNNNNYHEQLKSIERCADTISRELTELSLPDVREFVTEFRSGLKDLRKELIRIQNNWKTEIRDFYQLLLLFSALIYSDKIQAAGLKSERKDLLPGNLVDVYRQRRFAGSNNRMAPIREEVYRNAMSSLEQLLRCGDVPRVITITAPTGSGKTLLGLSVALKLREELHKRRGVVPRIIYVLPYINIIEQTHQVFSDVLRSSDVLRMSGICDGEVPLSLLIKHHHLAAFESQKGSDEHLLPERPLSELLLLTESWDSEIIVTTSVQLFETLLGTRNRMLKKFHKLCNAVIVLDEVQTLPIEYWLLIRDALTELTRTFNAHVVMMTATMPLIFREGAVELVKDAKQHFRQLDRTVYRYVGKSGSMTADELAEFAVRTWKEYDSLLVIVNTIPTSIRVYREIVRRLEAERLVRMGADERDLGNERVPVLAYLSTNIIPRERLRRIELLRELLRKNRRVLVVSTQLVEAGVDLDFDCVIRDVSPIDSIVQAGGRCNREWRREKGTVYIVRLAEAGQTPDSEKIYGNLAIKHVALRLLENEWSEFDESRLPELFEQYSKLLLDKYRYDACNESVSMLQAVRDMQLDEVGKFKLIEDEPKIPVFIELDEVARRALQEFRDHWEKRKMMRSDFEFLAMLRAAKARLEEYVVETWNFEGLPEERIAEGVDIRYIRSSEIDKYYDSETGLRLDNGVSVTVW